MQFRGCTLSCSVLALALACNGDGNDSGDTTGTTSAADTTATTTTPATTPATTTSEPTTTDDPDTSLATAETSADTTAGPTSDTTDTDTAPTGLACPLDDVPGTLQLALTPALFADGDDPSSDPACSYLNPERGFHEFVSLRSLDDGELDDIVAAGHTVIYGQVLIPEYSEKPLDDAILDQVSGALDLVRAHGMKVVPRFHYSDDIGEADAALDQILEHIEQLTPLLQQHADVILTLQAGFIGAYGEWHSSTNGLDAPGPRKAILDALLAALPADRTIGVRRPSFKADAYGGPLTADSAYDGSDLARIGHINDCFLASDDDEGTYQEPNEKDYAIADSAYVPVGGETCGVNPPRSECASALDELALLHWTHLNADYHPDVLQSWQDDGCYAEVACRLGYRLAATNLRWAASAVIGETLPVSLDLFNDGWAAPANPRPLALVFDGPGGRFEAVAEFDVRTARPGETRTICVDALVPENALPGTYTIGVRLADAAPTLADDPRQAIRLGNEELEWMDGINWFAATVDIQ